MAWLLLVIGAFVGGLTGALSGLVFGALLGFLLGHTLNLGSRVAQLELQVRHLKEGTVRETGAAEMPAAEASHKPSPEHRPEPPQILSTAPRGRREPELQLDEVFSPATSPERIEAAQPAATSKAPGMDPWESALERGINRLTASVTGFFLDGNVVVRVGIIVLFFGVAFLLKYAAEHGMLSIELRLIGAALGALVMIITGWRLRHRRPAYALLIQGGGIGIFYITVYAAAKLYHLLPVGLAFGLMLALVALSALLALLQDSRSLVAFGISGGFLAPVLTSTGGGNHVMLFSYYLLLNSGILAIAWFKAWRELNLLGFLFTFVIGTVWGLNYYRPDYFASVEPFLILFTLFYVAIAVLFALRQPLHLRGYVDGTLVFGVPIVGFSLQYGLVRDIEYGLAYSALALGFLYVLLAVGLWQRLVKPMRLLTESYLALGIAFGTMAIPLALDGRWTSAAWAMEGAALLWIGVRQQRLLPRLAGLLLQLGAGVAFFTDSYYITDSLPFLNGFFSGTLLLALAGLFSSYQLQKHAQALRAPEQPLHYPVLAWGTAWWVLGALQDIADHFGRADEYGVGLLLFAFTAVLFHQLLQRLDWRALRYPLLGLWPVVTLLALNAIDSPQLGRPFAAWASLPWLLLFGLFYRLLWRLRDQYPATLIRFGHSVTLWLLLFILGWEVQWRVGKWLPGTVWHDSSWAVVPLLAMGLLLWQGHRLAWPVRRYLTTYLGMAQIPVALMLLAWFGIVLYSAADPAPLPYLPLINPQELLQLMILTLLAMWILLHRRRSSRIFGEVEPRIALYLLGGMAFVLLNEVIAHTIHHWYGVSYRLESMHRSVLFQATVSVVWSVTALIMTVIATRLARRILWIIGASLLGLVVVKLFIVDLAGSGTIARIVSFIAAGVLMLLIGYLSPLPPKREEGGA